jgi:hypothetical protein
MEYLQSSLRQTGDAIVQDHITVLRFFLSKSVCMATEEDNAFIYACTHCHLQMANIMIEESVAPIAIDAADSVSTHFPYAVVILFKLSTIVWADRTDAASITPSDCWNNTITFSPISGRQFLRH